jgi:glycosyltransferase involved in cell wall biosynthesis
VSGKRVILFGGWFKLQSGLMDLVRGFHIVRRTRPELALVLIGDGALMPELRRYVAEHQVPDVVIPGLMPLPAFREYQQIADVVVTPESRTYFNELGAPLKLFECLASGRPTVATNIASHTPFIVDGENGFLVAADDPEALALGLERALDAPDAVQIGVRGRRRIAECHSWQRSCQLAVGAYDKVLAAESQRRKT